MLGRVIETLCILLAAKLVLSEEKPDVPLPVHGVINQSIDLLCSVDRKGSGLEIYWTFQAFILAVFTNNQMKIRNDQYKNRLETLDNGRTLRINNLRKEDGGIYSVTIYITEEKECKTSYNLTVHDPVPSPDIQTEVKENSPDGCNVTLHCSVPSHTSDLSYTWKYRQRDSEYRLYNTGSSIQISLTPAHQDTEFLCIVHNPADQKKVSCNVQHFCAQSKVDIRGHYAIGLTLAVLLILLVILGFFLYKRYNKRRKSEEENKNALEDINYSVHPPISPMCVYQRAERKEQEQRGTIVYSTLVHQVTDKRGIL